MKIEELGPHTREVSLVFRVLGKGEEKEVNSKFGGSHRVAEAQVGDDTGVVTMTLWDDDIEKVQEGETYALSNGYTSLFMGHIRLNIGRHGELQQSEENIENINEENDVSAREYEQRRFRRRFDRRDRF